MSDRVLYRFRNEEQADHAEAYAEAHGLRATREGLDLIVTFHGEANIIPRYWTENRVKNV